MPAPATTSKSEWPDVIGGRIVDCWGSPLLRNPVICIMLTVFLAGCCLTRAYIGMNGMYAYSHDGFVFLDGAWRVLNGQHSNVDFYSDHGPFMYLETSFGIWLANGSPAGFGYAQALVSAILGLWAFLLSSRRLVPVARALFCIIVVLLAASPCTLGEAIVRTTPAMVYNRFGYCMVALVILESALRRERFSPFWGTGRRLFDRMHRRHLSVSQDHLLFLDGSSGNSPDSCPHTDPATMDWIGIRVRRRLSPLHLLLPRHADADDQRLAYCRRRQAHPVALYL